MTNRFLSSALSFALGIVLVGTSWASPQVGASESGTLANEASSNAGKIKCWVMRSGDDAFALNIQPVPFGNGLRAFLRQYEKAAGGTGYTPVPIKLQTQPVGTDPEEFTDPIEVSLEQKMTASGITYYTMSYGSGASAFSIGAVRFLEGNGGRASSDVVVRFDPDKMKSVQRDPCNEPPADDMGEEEEVLQDGSFLPLKAPPVATAEEP